ncbi:Uncharacterised protein [Enterobacter cloacae]|nr:Uncharacterised protein [Enterobacter cloacae]
MPRANEHQRPVIFTQATHAVTELVQQVLQIFEGDGDVCFTDSILQANHQRAQTRDFPVQDGISNIFPCCRHV